MSVNESERAVWTDAYRFFADHRGMKDTDDDWEQAGGEMAELFVKHGMTQYAQAVLTGAYKALGCVVHGKSELEGTD